MPKYREWATIIPVPIYDQALEFVVTTNSSASQERRKAQFQLEETSPCIGCVLHHEYNFAFLIERQHLNHEIIAHEIFHATHRILEYVTSEAKFRRNEDEPYAYLCGYLTREVYRQLKKWKLKVT